MSSLSNSLPDELVVKILCRLPSKSLMRFRCVCKSWFSLITDQSFISLHRRYSPSFPLVFKNNNLSLCSPRHDDNHSDGVVSPSSPSSFLLPFDDEDFYIVINSNCHDLLCIRLKDCSFIICNPFIRRFLSTPKIPHYPKDLLYPEFQCVAFGFDSRNHDYKILSLVLGDNYNNVPTIWADVFSLKTRSWRHLPHYVSRIDYIGNHLHGSANGLHCTARRWLVAENRYHYFVLSFDLQDEVFSEVVLPECISYTSTLDDYCLDVVNGGGDTHTLTVSHCIRYGYTTRSGSVWVMKEYGVVESWNKVFHYDIFDDFCFDASAYGMKITNVKEIRVEWCIANNEKTLLLVYAWLEERQERQCYFLDVEGRKFVELPIGVYIYSIFDVSFFDSLVLLNVDGLQSY